MNERLIRTELLLGAEGVKKLQRSRVAVFGVGGVGGFALEALSRSGVGHLTIVDRDRVSESNLNRQIIATTKTIGRLKTEVMKERILEINPEADVTDCPCFYLPETAGQFDFTQYDYIIDAVDTVTAKLELIARAKEAGTPVISCMGAGNKLDPAGFMVTDISRTSVCPLARVMRRELKKRGISHVKVVYSREEPTVLEKRLDLETGKAVPGSIAFVPSVAGLILAGEVIRELAGQEES